MARFPAVTPQPVLPTRDMDALRERMREEFDTGLDKTGPQWEREGEEQEAAVRAAGVTAYFPFNE